MDYAGKAFAQGEDPTVLVEEDGGAVLCTSFGQRGANVPWCAPLNPDMKSLARNQSQVVIEGLAPGQFFEAPWLFKRNGTYYLSFVSVHRHLFSANWLWCHRKTSARHTRQANPYN